MAIPARGGSKRLPGKNTRILAGIPMIAHTIQAAQQAGLGSEIYVCSEDEHILSIAEENGARTFCIPMELAGDEISSTVPCLRLYRSLISKGVEIDYIFNLQPTSPLRTSEDIRQSYKRIIEYQADYLVSTTFIDPHYFHWALEEKNNGWEMYFGKKYLKERTQLPPVFRPNGAIKLAKAARLNETENFFGNPLQTYIMPEERSVHVATISDFLLCETLLSIK